MRLPGNPPDPLRYELMQEMAASLGRAGRRLERALAALAAGCEGDDRLAEAAEALWYLVVQREACGMRNTEELMRELSVPVEVQLRMGPRRLIHTIRKISDTP
jgi:hypothetical protein